MLFTLDFVRKFCSRCLKALNVFCLQKAYKKSPELLLKGGEKIENIST